MVVVLVIKSSRHLRHRPRVSSFNVVLVTNVIIVVAIAFATYHCRSRFVSIQISKTPFALFTTRLFVLDPRQSLDEEGSFRA